LISGSSVLEVDAMTTNLSALYVGM
jgi:hypothetical protein